MVLSPLRKYSARHREKYSITLLFYIFYPISINVVVIMHSLPSHPIFSEEPITVKSGLPGHASSVAGVCTAVFAVMTCRVLGVLPKKSLQPMPLKQYGCSFSSSYPHHFHYLHLFHLLTAETRILTDHPERLQAVRTPQLFKYHFIFFFISLETANKKAVVLFLHIFLFVYRFSP